MVSHYDNLILLVDNYDAIILLVDHYDNIILLVDHYDNLLLLVDHYDNLLLLVDHCNVVVSLVTVFFLALQAHLDRVTREKEDALSELTKTKNELAIFQSSIVEVLLLAVDIHFRFRVLLLFVNKNWNGFTCIAVGSTHSQHGQLSSCFFWDFTRKSNE